MQNEFLAHIRAQAYALVKIARGLADPLAAQELERIALELLQHTHDFERGNRLG